MGLCGCTLASSSCGEQRGGPCLAPVRGLPLVGASLVSSTGSGTRASVVSVHRLTQGEEGLAQRGSLKMKYRRRKAPSRSQRKRNHHR